MRFNQNKMNYRVNRLFKKTKKPVARKPKQWYRPGHGYMAKYERRGVFYKVTSRRRSQYKPSKFRTVYAVPGASLAPPLPRTPSPVFMEVDSTPQFTPRFVEVADSYMTPSPVRLITSTGSRRAIEYPSQQMVIRQRPSRGQGRYVRRIAN